MLWGRLAWRVLCNSSQIKFLVAELFSTFSKLSAASRFKTACVLLCCCAVLLFCCCCLLRCKDSHVLQQWQQTDISQCSQPCSAAMRPHRLSVIVGKVLSGHLTFRSHARVYIPSRHMQRALQQRYLANRFLFAVFSRSGPSDCVLFSKVRDACLRLFQGA